MGLYLQRLARLRSEIATIKQRRKKKFKKDQQIMIDFINGATKYALFEVSGTKIYLRRGDTKKGFEHILLRHYCDKCPGEISTMDILNMVDVVKRGIKLANVGVSNNNLIVFQQIKGSKQLKIVLKPIGDNNLVITLYHL
jgi:DNA polymerase III epsilon subunit-like protein